MVRSTKMENGNIAFLKECYHPMSIDKSWKQNPGQSASAMEAKSSPQFTLFRYYFRNNALGDGPAFWISFPGRLDVNINRTE